MVKSEAMTEENLITKLLRGEFTTAANMPFEFALKCLRRGAIVWRAGWNGERMFVFLAPSITVNAHKQPLERIFKGDPVRSEATLMLKTADETVVAWTVSQTDLLARDWCVSFGRPAEIFGTPPSVDGASEESGSSESEEGSEG